MSKQTSLPLRQECFNSLFIKKHYSDSYFHHKKKHTIWWPQIPQTYKSMEFPDSHAIKLIQWFIMESLHSFRMKTGHQKEQLDVRRSEFLTPPLSFWGWETTSWITWQWSDQSCLSNETSIEFLMQKIRGLPGWWKVWCSRRAVHLCPWGQRFCTWDHPDVVLCTSLCYYSSISSFKKK